MLDYGCGHGRIINALREASDKYAVYGYDPAMPQFEDLPDPADVVTCTDVMEHVEAECVDSVLRHVASLTLKVAFIVIATSPAKSDLPDGRNAHITQRPEGWWQDKLEKFFRSVKVTERRVAGRTPTFQCIP